MISIDQYWMGRDKLYPDDLTLEIRRNAQETVDKVNELLHAYSEETGKVVDDINSGWRPPAVNDATSNAADKSRHITGEACDLGDPDGDLDKWCMANVPLLVEIGLWVEHPGWTDGWCHLQTQPPPAGRGARIFALGANPPVTIYGSETLWA